MPQKLASKTKIHFKPGWYYETTMEAHMCLHLLLCFSFSSDCMQINCCWVLKSPKQLLQQCYNEATETLAGKLCVNRMLCSAPSATCFVRLTWDVISHVFYVHLMQPHFCRSVSHCYSAILVIHNVWCIGLSRGHVYFTYEKAPREPQEEKLPASPLPPTKNCLAILSKQLLNYLPTGTNRRLTGTLNRHGFY